MNLSTMPKYCINLARRPDRREHAEQEFKKHGLDVEFVTAVDGDDIILPELSIKACEYYAKENWACVLSHLSIINRATAEYICVFEDDVKLCEGFSEQMASIDPPEFDIFYLGGGYKEGKDIGGGFHSVKVMTGTWAYILGKKAGDFIARNITYDWGPDQFYSDVVLKWFKGITYLPMLSTLSPLAAESNIGGPSTAR